MEKLIVKSSLVLFQWMVTAYLLGAFINTSFNIMDWNSFTKGIIGLTLLVVSVVISLSIFFKVLDDYDNN